MNSGGRANQSLKHSPNNISQQIYSYRYKTSLSIILTEPRQKAFAHNRKLYHQRFKLNLSHAVFRKPKFLTEPLRDLICVTRVIPINNIGLILGK